MNEKKVLYIHDEDLHNTNSAEVIVPILVEKLNPHSVLDVGCGIGTWLKVFKDHGVNLLKGIDGDYLDRNLLKKYIEEKDFIEMDISRPFNLGVTFDLILSLEVAEHLPEIAAEDFVSSLILHGNNILFSAAIPNQGGQNHLNEQWPTYWAEKFKIRGYEAYDIIRPHIWTDKRIDIFYRQNILLFSKSLLPFPKAILLDVVLPEYWNICVEKERLTRKRKERLQSGKAGIIFYMKLLFKSLSYFGRKIK